MNSAWMREAALVPLMVLLARGPWLMPEARAQDLPRREYVEIVGVGRSAVRIGLPPLAVNGSLGDQARLVREVLGRDLELCGLFQVLKSGPDPGGSTAGGAEPDRRGWADAGAQALVTAAAQPFREGLAIRWSLHDLVEGNGPVLSRTIQGSSARKLAHHMGDEIVRHFTGERGVFNTRISFVRSSKDNRQAHVYVTDYDGHGVHRVSVTSELNMLPAWSPAGLLAYTTYHWGNPDLALVPAAGGAARRLSRFAGLNSGAAFSPSGKEIALTLTKDGAPDLYVIDLAGKVLRRLTRSPAIDTSPTWSPDGGQIAFVSDRGGSPQIHVLPARGGTARRLTFGGTYNQEPDWCPRQDQPLVAFTGRVEGGSYDIFTINVQTAELRRLTRGEGSNMSPSWAPNGRLMVFASSRGGLWIMDADGLGQQQVFAGRAETPAWSRW